MSPPSPTSTLFPYTTLFRSRRADRDKSAHFVLDQRGDFLVVVSFVDAARDEDDRLAEALERVPRSEEHTSELQSRGHLVCRLLLEKKNSRGDRSQSTCIALT